jgi:hypothetical protein
MATIVLQHRKGVLYMVHAEMLYAGQVSEFNLAVAKLMTIQVMKLPL